MNRQLEKRYKAYQSDKDKIVKNWQNEFWLKPILQAEKKKTGLMWKDESDITKNSSGTSTTTTSKTTINTTSVLPETSSGTGMSNTSSVMLNPSAGLTKNLQNQTTNMVTQNPVITTQSAWKSNSKPRGGTLVSGNKNTLSSQNDALDSATDTALNNTTTGSQIKNKVKNEIVNRYGYINNRHLFDDIDDETIEKNIPVAENAIQTNIDTGRLEKDYEKKYPNMKPGMTMFYAAMDKNKSKDAKAARDVAYTEYSSANNNTENVFLSSLINDAKPDEGIVSESQELDYSALPVKNQGSRYVGEDGATLRAEPGNDSGVLDAINKGTEVQYTGRKTKEIDGHLWAEVEYDGKIGWVAADDLRISKPDSQTTLSTNTSSSTTDSNKSSGNNSTHSSDSPVNTNKSEDTQTETVEQKSKPGSRYVGDDGLRLRSQPGLSSDIIASMNKGTEVRYTGKKTEEIDGHMWAEVEYGGKTGWVAADYLKTSKPDIQPKKSTTKNDYNFDKFEDWNFLHLYNKTINNTHNFDKSNAMVYKENVPNKRMPLDENAPKDLYVEKQNSNVEERTEYLNENIPQWMAERKEELEKKIEFYTKQKKFDIKEEYEKDLRNVIDLINWYKEKGATVRYTGSYYMPVRSKRINQAFYGMTSHGGKKDDRYNDDFGFLGAIDFSATTGEPTYAVLPGKVVYVDSDGDDMHRVTLETEINGETYYLEYLHLNEIKTEKGAEVNMGTQIGTVGGWGNNKSDAYPAHLDFRVYQFKNDNNTKNYSDDSSKTFIDPFELFDFDVQLEYETKNHDYH